MLPVSFFPLALYDGTLEKLLFGKTCVVQCALDDPLGAHSFCAAKKCSRPSLRSESLKNDKKKPLSPAWIIAKYETREWFYKTSVIYCLRSCVP